MQSNRKSKRISGLWVAVVVGIAMMGGCNEAIEVPTEVLQPGWQFYSNPTTLEPVGTVFRIDPEGRRFIVTSVDVPTSAGREAMGDITTKVTTSGDTIARFLKLAFVVEAEAKKYRSFEFRMKGAERSVSSDVDVAGVLDTFLENVPYRFDNRYFIIREVRSARELHYVLDDSLIAGLGGAGALTKMATVDGNVSFDSGKNYNLSQIFAEPMRVMFLPEEIVPDSASLGTDDPEFQVIPVEEVLEWQ